MRAWNDRPEEVKNLYNPAFCGRVLHATVAEYTKKTGRDFPFPLVYLVLPLVMVTPIRDEIDSKTRLTIWAQSHQELLYNFGKRASDLVEITNEAVEFMLQTGILRITYEGDIAVSITDSKISRTKYTDDEVIKCITKAEHVARWFATAGRISTIYMCLGVRP